MTKRALDVVLALLGLVLTAPVLLVAAAAVRIRMGRPVLFRQVRAGRDGVPFRLLKLRTMLPPLREGGEWDDEATRLTPLGLRLRRSSVDELPTLVNVLRGDMSLVGPRPLPTDYTERYSPTQRRRLSVRPGVTGLAQVSGRNSLGWEERFALDVAYVDSRSTWLDLRILLRTVSQVLHREGIAMEGHLSSPRFLGEEGGTARQDAGATSTDR